MTTLILIRHGQTSSNIAGLLDTALPGAELSELGHAQAHALVELLADRPVTAVTASAALRARQTAAPLAAARELPVTVDPRLREVAAGVWEMAGDQDSVTGYLGTVATWLAGRLDVRTPGPDGESGAQVLARFDAGIRDAVGRAKEQAGGRSGTAVVVAHGAVLRFWAPARSANLANDFGAHHLSNTGRIVLEGDPDTGWHCHSWAELPVPPLPGNDLPASPPPGAGLDGPADEDPPAQEKDFA